MSLIVISFTRALMKQKAQISHVGSKVHPDCKVMA